MAFELVRELGPEEIPKSPLSREWEGLKQDFSSPQQFLKSFLGPGLLSQGLGKLLGKSKEDAYEDLLNLAGTGATIANPALGGASVAARAGSAALIPMLSHLLTRGMGSPGEGLVKGGIGAGTQGISDAIFGGLKQFGMQKAARGAKERFKVASEGFDDRLADATDAHTQTTQQSKAAYESLVKDIRHQDAVNIWTGRKAHQADKSTRLSQHAQQAQEQKGQYESAVKDIRQQDAQMIRAARQKHIDDKNATLDQHAAQVAEQQTQFGSQQALSGQEAAKLMMDDVKAVVPAWRELPSDTAGMTTAVLGKGPTLLSQEFNKAMEAIIQSGRGRDIELPLEYLIKLHVPLKGVNAARPGDDVIVNKADAGLVAKAIVGTWKENPQMYHETIEALDAMNIGDSAARLAYKTGIRFNEFMAGIKAIDVLPEGSVLHTDRIVKAMSDKKMIDILRKPGIADVDEGLLQIPRSRTLTAPPEIPEPRIDPFVAPPRTRLPDAPQIMAPQIDPYMAPPRTRIPDPPVVPKAPTAATFEGGPPLDPTREGGEIAGLDLGTRGQRMGVGAATGAITAGAAGAVGIPMGWGAYSFPAATGTLIGAALPNQWLTKAPGSDALTEIFRRLSKEGGSALNQTLVEGSRKLGLLDKDLTMADLLEIERTKAERLKALGTLAEEDPDEELNMIEEAVK